MRRKEKTFLWWNGTRIDLIKFAKIVQEIFFVGKRARIVSLPSILPFGLDPSNTGLDRFTAYWYVTCMNAAYGNQAAEISALYALAGATSVQTVHVPGLVIPEADIAFFPDNKAVVTFQGTRFFLEWIRQILGSQLALLAPWPGFVGQYHALVAINIWDQVRPILVNAGITTIALAGHSQGGAICQLLPNLIGDSTSIGLANICTCGAPRTGSPAYASVQGSRYLRLTNTGDPVPLLPPAISPALDRFLWLIPPIEPLSYAHWGTRIHLWANGSATMPVELPTWLDGSRFLADQALNGNAWFTNHDTTEYARRLRAGIPAGIGEANPTYPGLQALDLYWEGKDITPAADLWMDPPICS